MLLYFLIYFGLDPGNKRLFMVVLFICCWNRKNNNIHPCEQALSKCKYWRNYGRGTRSHGFSLHMLSVRLRRCLQVKPGLFPPVYAGCWCSVNGPVEGVLIDSSSPLWFSLTPVPRVACISPGSPAASHVSLFPPCSLTVRRQVARRVPNLGRDHRQEVEEEEEDSSDISEIRLL